MVLQTLGNADSFSQDQPLTFSLLVSVRQLSSVIWTMSWTLHSPKMFIFKQLQLMFWALQSNKVLPIRFRCDKTMTSCILWPWYLLIQSFPVIIALETSPGTSIGNRASVLHAILQGKHASLLNTRYTVSARASFDYQKKVSVDSVRGSKNFLSLVRILRRPGFRLQPTPIALLQRWYSHVREKRQTRQDFLKSLVKVFQENSSYESTQVWFHYRSLSLPLTTFSRMMWTILDIWLRILLHSIIRLKRKFSLSSSLLRAYFLLPECSY